MSTTIYPHVEIDAAGVAFVTGTRTKVVEIVLDRLAHGWDADEIHRQHPHLTLAQIHSAFAYYYDHRVEVDAEIRRGLEYVESVRGEAGELVVRAKLQRAMDGL